MRSDVVIPCLLQELDLKENKLDKDLQTRWWLLDQSFASKTLLAEFPSLLYLMPHLQLS